MSDGQDGQNCNVAGACSREPDAVGKESRGRQRAVRKGSPQLEAATLADGASDGGLPVHPPEVFGADLCVPV